MYRAEELLIDFRKLIGEHSGENMAQVVWTTLKVYGIEGRVSRSVMFHENIINIKSCFQIFAFMLDNASNNDTMVDGIQARARKEGIEFNALWGRLWCMPHTIHLAAIKVSI